MLRYLDSAIAFAVVMLGVSLLVTVATQMISAVLAARGRSLRWGLTTLIRTIAPAAATNAQAIVERVLRHPLISDSTFNRWSALPVVGQWKLATAIRKDEMIAVLQNLYETASDPKCADRELLKIRHSIQEALSAITISPLADIPVLITEIRKLQGGAETSGKRALELVESVHRAKGEFKFWFDACMDRVSQRFSTQMRMWTVAFAIAIAFAAHLDALRLAQGFFSDPAQRDAMVAAAADITRQAVLVSQNTTVAQAYGKAMAEVLAGSSDAKLKALTPPASFDSRADAEKWLRAQLAGNLRADEVLKGYQDKVDALLSAKMNEFRDEFNATTSTLKAADFELIPSPYPGKGNEYSTPSSLWSIPRPTKHFVGTLVTAFLLSLGAPFWFNSLKSLTNLRPLLAQKQTKEVEGEEERKGQDNNA